MSLTLTEGFLHIKYDFKYGYIGSVSINSTSRFHHNSIFQYGHHTP